ncbi:MAG: hypothetical protein WKG07_08895 [Hymenobacter sp.]
MAIRAADLHRQEGRALSVDLPRVVLSNRIEKDPFAAALARWSPLGSATSSAWTTLGLSESAFRCLSCRASPRATLWRSTGLACDAIVGNPPFHGTKTMQRALRRRLPALPRAAASDVGVKDYCVYWFRRAHGSPSKPGASAQASWPPTPSPRARTDRGRARLHRCR